MNQDTTGVHWALVLLALTGPRQSRLLAPTVKVASGLQGPWHAARGLPATPALQVPVPGC